MQVTSKEWQDVMTYVQKKLLDQIGNGDSISRITVIGVLQDITAEQYSADTHVVRGKRKPVQIDNEYDQSWRLFWNTWPSTKSVPGTQYRSGAKMKGNEQGMYKKWLAAVVSDISVERMQYAAECYLQWAYTESISKGRNELEYRNAMEPWLNQSLYLNYADVPMPPVTKQQIQYQNSTDQ
jgi:hypothetical protein